MKTGLSAGHAAACGLAGVLIVLLPLGAGAGQPQSSGPDRAGRALPAVEVTFNHDIAPLLWERCAGCHRPGQPAPFSLITYQDAVRHATQIAEVTRRRYMPPWKPDPGVGEFEDQRRLSDEEIAMIDRWVRGGRPEGEPADLPPAPRWPAEWRLGPPDVIVGLPAPYITEPEGSDLFRTFVIPIPVRERKYVRAVEFDPGQTKAVHHANLKIDATRSSRWLDEQVPGPGYEGAGARGAQFPDGHFLGWTPGQSPRVAAPGVSWRLDPASDLVLELHMMTTGKPEAVQPRIGLYFIDQPPARLPYMIRLGRQDIDIPPGDPRYVRSDSYVLPVDVEIIALQPHAHNLARAVRAAAVLPDGSISELIAISDWDTRWQDVYRLRRPFVAPKGTRLTMEYIYDNSAANIRNPNRPPRRVTFGQTSAAEMGDLWLQVMPRNAADRHRLHRDYAPKMLFEDIRGLEKIIELQPTDGRLHADLGFCYLEDGRSAEALIHLTEAARLGPYSPGAQYDVGTLLLGLRRFPEAREFLNRALALKPDFPEALNNLGVVSHAQRRFAEALGWYERSLGFDPDNAEAHYNAGRALVALDDGDAARRHFDHALRQRPDDAGIHVSLGSLLASRQEIEPALVHYRRALELNPDLPPALVDLAWILATSDSARVRAPEEAVRLAERATELTGRQNATVLDTLAIAYAASGHTERAIATAEEALKLATGSGLRELAERIRLRLSAYRQSVKLN